MNLTLQKSKKIKIIFVSKIKIWMKYRKATKIKNKINCKTKEKIG